MNDQGHRFVNALAYIGILFFLPLVVMPGSKIGKFHANQGLIILLLGIAGNVAIAIFPFLGNLIYSIFNLGLFILMVIGIYNAAIGKMKPLPFIGQIIIIS